MLFGFCLLLAGLGVLLIVLVGYVYFSVGVGVLLVQFIVVYDLVSLYLVCGACFFRFGCVELLWLLICLFGVGCSLRLDCVLLFDCFHLYFGLSLRL